MWPFSYIWTFLFGILPIFPAAGVKNAREFNLPGLLLLNFGVYASR